MHPSWIWLFCLFFLRPSQVHLAAGFELPGPRTLGGSSQHPFPADWLDPPAGFLRNFLV